ncbi:MAG: FAD-binding oxidoreductase [Candidatus Dadabacteria bacterium]|nr:FAD-binding oxidoreductase [Candidatus Dadabacteria bacterium]MDE0477163.1 FAD-binding oxidoreductase [Candidatus Dadabacteria bacterium]
MSHVTEFCKMVSASHVPVSGDTGSDVPEFGFSPEVILYPENIEEISRVLGFASQKGIRVFPFAGGTKLFLGNPVGAVGAALSLKRLGRVLFHEPSDMVSTVECGMEVREFQNAVGRENQLFPVDPPGLNSGATVGGLLSTNLCGPMSTRYGTCRELILGVRAVRADGEIINLGGKVVKNVAGYDIPKLMAGSLGTLCVLVEATFRLYPRQPFSRTLVLGFDSHVSCSRAARAILAADVVPTCFEILDERLSLEFAAAPGAKRSVLLKFDSFEEAVIEQIKQVREITSGDSVSFIEMGDQDSRELWDSAREFPLPSGASFSSKLTLPVTASIEIFSDIESNPALSGVTVRCLSRPARGVALISVSGGGEEAVRAAHSLENLADSLGGRIMFSGVRDELRERIKAWGDFGEALFLMKNIKRRFDPGNILPGEKIFDAD